MVTGRAEMGPHAGSEALDQLQLRYRLGAAIADAYFDAGFSVVVQDVVLGPALVEYTKLIRSRPLCVSADRAVDRLVGADARRDGRADHRAGVGRKGLEPLTPCASCKCSAN